jgi:hypothetical protein
MDFVASFNQTIILFHFINWLGLQDYETDHLIFTTLNSLNYSVNALLDFKDMYILASLPPGRRAVNVRLVFYIVLSVQGVKLQ